MVSCAWLRLARYAAAAAWLSASVQAQVAPFADLAVSSYTSANDAWPAAATGFVVSGSAAAAGTVQCVARVAGSPAPSAADIFTGTAPAPLIVGSTGVAPPSVEVTSGETFAVEFTGASQYTLPRCNPASGHLCAATGYQVYCATDSTDGSLASQVSSPVSALGCNAPSAQGSPVCRPSYIGCFNDNGGSVRDLPVEAPSTSGVDAATSISECRESCRDYRFFGLQFDAECRCGNSYGAQGENAVACGPDGTMCGDGSSTCGNLNAVYSIPTDMEYAGDADVLHHDANRKDFADRLDSKGKLRCKKHPSTRDAFANGLSMYSRDRLRQIISDGGESHKDLYSKAELLKKATEVYTAKFGSAYVSQAGDMDEWDCFAPHGQYV